MSLLSMDLDPERELCRAKPRAYQALSPGVRTVLTSARRGGGEGRVTDGDRVKDQRLFSEALASEAYGELRLLYQWKINHLFVTL